MEEKEIYHKKMKNFSDKYVARYLSGGITLAGITVSIIGSAIKNSELANWGQGLGSIGAIYFSYCMGQYNGERQFCKENETPKSRLIDMAKEFFIPPKKKI